MATSISRISVDMTAQFRFVFLLTLSSSADRLEPLNDSALSPDGLPKPNNATQRLGLRH